MLKLSQLSTTRKFVLSLVVIGIIGVLFWAKDSFVFLAKHWPVTALLVLYVGFRVHRQYSASKRQHDLYVQYIKDALQARPMTLSELAQGMDHPQPLQMVQSLLDSMQDDIEQVSKHPVRYQWRV